MSFMLNAFLHREQNRITAESAEELAKACNELKVTAPTFEGYAELTDKQYERAALRGIPRVDARTFAKVVERLNKEIEI